MVTQVVPLKFIQTRGLGSQCNKNIRSKKNDDDNDDDDDDNDDGYYYYGNLTYNGLILALVNCASVMKHRV